MRVLIAAAIVALAATPALAQGLNAEGLRPKPAIDPTETSPVQRLKDDAREWIARERARQAVNPTALIDLAVDIEREIGPDLDKVARRERIGDGDLFLVVMYDIVAGAQDDAAKTLEQLRASGASDIEIQTAATAKARLDANLAEVTEEQTVVSRSLIPALAWRN